VSKLTTFSEARMQHRNALLTPNGRLRMVQLVEVHGLTFEAAAAASNVAKSTAWGWVQRWRAASPEQRRSLSCLEDRPSTPRRSPRMLSEADHERVCELRRRTGWGPRLIASEVELPHSTVHRALRRRGCSRRPRAARETVVRYEWPCPGDLLHMDTKRFARFSSPGHAVTGDRHRTGAEKRERVGYDVAHSIVDDHSRLAYTELHRDQRAATVTAFLERALGFFAAHGIEARRLMTDNHFSYSRNASLRRLLAERGIRHLFIEIRRPQTNGKVERYQQTLKREWARGQRYRSSDHRAAALPHWLNYYNERRRHSAIANRPPISRVRNVPGQNS
jgi:transposase InsO family protein